MVPNAVPKVSPPRKLGPAQRAIETAWATQQLAMGLYEQASQGCLWASCLHIAPTWTKTRQAGGTVVRTLKKLRVCGDYRAVNTQLANIAQAVPLISDIKQKMKGHLFYARFDMSSGFNALTLAEGSRDILAVRTSIGLLRPTVMPFGPKSCPTKYGRIIESLVCAHKDYGVKIFVYCDDILVCADTEDELMDLCCFVARTVGRRGGTLKPSKCRIGYAKEVILGSEVSKEGIRPSPEHIAAVQNVVLPKNPSEMRSIVGLFTYFFEHFAWFSTRMAPLHELTKDGVKWPTPLPKAVVAAIEDFKKDMTEAPLLVTFDPARQVYLDSRTAPSMQQVRASTIYRATHGSQSRISHTNTHRLNHGGHHTCVRPSR